MEIQFVNIQETDPREALLLQMTKDDIIQLQAEAKPLMLEVSEDGEQDSDDSSVEEKLSSIKL